MKNLTSIKRFRLIIRIFAAIIWLRNRYLVIQWFLPEATLRWRHNGRDSVSNHQPHHCLLNRLFRRRSKKTSKRRVTGLCAGNSPGTGEFPAQMASNAENVSIWWRHYASYGWVIIEDLSICRRVCTFLISWGQEKRVKHCYVDLSSWYEFWFAIILMYRYERHFGSFYRDQTILETVNGSTQTSLNICFYWNTKTV